MFSKPRRDFCLWVVPPSDGRVRKVRFTFRRAVFIFLLLLAVCSTFLYIAGDYTRVQVLRAKNYLSLKKVTQERDTLIWSNESLKSEVSNLKELNSEVLDYEQNIRARLEELNAVLESASSLGMVSNDFAASKEEMTDETSNDARERDDVGGLEIDCMLAGGSESCPDRISSSANNPKEDVHFALNRSRKANLLSQMDNLAEVLEKLPLGAPGNGFISSHYGYRRSPFSGRIRMHQGIDISMATGSYVRATALGRVKSVKRTSTYGLVVDVQHANRVVTRYAHLSNALVSEGESVCRGSVLGLAGSTGRSTGPHLHYEIRVKGKAIDPRTFMRMPSDMNTLF